MKKMIAMMLLASSVSYGYITPGNGPGPSPVGGDILTTLDQCSLSCNAYCSNLVNQLQQRLGTVNTACGGVGSVPPPPPVPGPGAIDQALYQDAYTWAYSGNGLNLTTQGAQSFADRITRTPNARASFESFKTTYVYAYSGNGLNLTTQGAQALAWKIVSQAYPQASLDCYKKAYTFAYSGTGMNLTAEGARAHAEKTCNIR